MIDHTILRPEAGRDEVAREAALAVEWGCASICVQPEHVAHVVSIVGDRIPVATVVGFSHGATLSSVKAHEAAAAVAHGAREVDVVASLGAIADDDLDAVRDLVALDADWVPDGKGEQALYIRPFQIASEPYLGVRPASGYTFAVIASPVGAYYDEPVHLWVTPNYTRAAPGGTGAAKCGGNYAASLIAATEAEEQGCGQVLWTDGAERKYIEECGTMNFMFITRAGELVTPELTGSILPGVTRDSLLKLAPDHGLTPVERRITVEELFAGVDSGDVVEALACGTAAVVTPIIGFKAPGGVEHTIADGEVGSKTQELRQHLVDIQYGRADDKHGWTIKVA